MRCINCDYDLRDLPEARCPECGRAFDPDDPATYRSSLRREPISALRLWGELLCFLMAFLCYWSYVIGPDDGGPPTVVDRLFTGFGVSVFGVGGVALRCWKRR